MIIKMIHGEGFAPSTQVNLDPQQLSLDNAYVTIQDDSLKGAQIQFNHFHIKLNNDIELDQIIGSGNYIVPKDDKDNEFVQEGMAIFIKGQMVLGIHPNNLENNLKAFKDGDIQIDWETLGLHVRK